jgi:hypothetical protein
MGRPTVILLGSLLRVQRPMSTTAPGTMSRYTGKILHKSACPSFPFQMN